MSKTQESQAMLARLAQYRREGFAKAAVLMHPDNPVLHFASLHESTVGR